jgi:exodeoxyribonuclease VII large subunit
MSYDSTNQTIFSISEVNKKARLVLEGQIGRLRIRGECSSMHMHKPSNHWYFTLKDDKSSISCVMYSRYAAQVIFVPKLGDSLLVTGYVTIYEVKGGYQLIVEKMQQAGVGDLYIAFEAMKNKLAKEGLFAESQKKILPNWINHIGVVTSPSGAVIKDILNVLKQTAPTVMVDVIPCAVQGKAAKTEIIKAIKIAEQTSEIEVIIIARGGGSIEDLWCFNEEEVARAIFNCSKPVISAIGHETDFTIADFTADIRAATPSVAAKLIADKICRVVNKLEESKNILVRVISHKLEVLQGVLANLSHRLSKLERIIFTNMQLLDDHAQTMQALINNKISTYKSRLNEIEKQLIQLDPIQLLIKRNNQLKNLQEKSQSLMVYKLKQYRSLCLSLAARLEALNPLSVLKRGYSIVKKNSDVVTSYNQVNVGDELDIILNEGYLSSKVCKSNKNQLK